MPTIPRVAVVATGVVGRSWGRLFAEAGCRVQLHDVDLGQAEQALDWLEQSLSKDVSEGLLEPEAAQECRDRVEIAATLGKALEGCGWVQESGPEDEGTKRELLAAIDAGAEPRAIIGTSTSTLNVDDLVEGLPGADRFLVAHPVNPPHVIPAVEVLPAAGMEMELVERAMAFLNSVGQTPVLLRHYISGFLLNRMQAALVREAIHLVVTGAAGVDEVDAVIRDGLGLRWALLGPFGTANTNADGGIREYLNRYADSYRRLMEDLGPTRSLGPEIIEQLGAGTDAMESRASREEVRRWRDKLVRMIRNLKLSNPHP